VQPDPKPGWSTIFPPVTGRARRRDCTTSGDGGVEPHLLPMGRCSSTRTSSPSKQLPVSISPERPGQEWFWSRHSITAPQPLVTASVSQAHPLALAPPGDGSAGETSARKNVPAREDPRFTGDSASTRPLLRAGTDWCVPPWWVIPAD